jgi:hypothetical protein
MSQLEILVQPNQSWTLQIGKATQSVYPNPKYPRSMDHLSFGNTNPQLVLPSDDQADNYLPYDAREPFLKDLRDNRNKSGD